MNTIGSQETLEVIDIEVQGETTRYGSDAIAETFRSIGLPYIALTPGASFRGIHDSIVNHLGNVAPRILLCLHEEHAVALAHGYAKVARRPLGAFVHTNIGLMHASMAIYNAWCDRVPVLIFGATGPLDAAKRRPWIDWIHTSQNQASMVRGFTKWDDQPMSPAAAVESILRAEQIAMTKPCGPVYICFDSELQEDPDVGTHVPTAARFGAPDTSYPRPELVARVADLLLKSKKSTFLMGRVEPNAEAWSRRIELAERTGARVVTHDQLAAAFPSEHPLSVGPPVSFMSPKTSALLRESDLIIALDWLDLGGTLKRAFPADFPATVVSASVDFVMHNAEQADYMSLPPVDIPIACQPDDLVSALLATLREHTELRKYDVSPPAPKPALPERMSMSHIAAALEVLRRTQALTYLHLPVSWDPADSRIAEPLDYIGGYGGGGLAAGPGVAVGAALALRDAGVQRLPVAILGDGDFLMGASAIWTAVQERIPLLIVVNNNRAYYNDVTHQERVARTRKRSIENRFVGLVIQDPPVDIAALARSYGAAAFGPVENVDSLNSVLASAAAIVNGGGVCVVDVIFSNE